MYVSYRISDTDGLRDTEPKGIIIIISIMIIIIIIITPSPAPMVSLIRGNDLTREAYDDDIAEGLKIDVQLEARHPDAFQHPGDLS